MPALWPLPYQTATQPLQPGAGLYGRQPDTAHSCQQLFLPVICSERPRKRYHPASDTGSALGVRYARNRHHGRGLYHRYSRGDPGPAPHSLPATGTGPIQALASTCGKGHIPCAELGDGLSVYHRSDSIPGKNRCHGHSGTWYFILGLCRLQHLLHTGGGQP